MSQARLRRRADGRRSSAAALGVTAGKRGDVRGSRRRGPAVGASAGRDTGGRWAAARWRPRGFRGGKSAECPLDLALVRGIGSPGQPELALGAIIDGENLTTVSRFERPLWPLRVRRN